MKNRVLLPCIIFAYCNMAVAATPEAYITDSGISILPTLDTGLKYDDNIFSQGSDTTASGIFTLAPDVSLSLDDGINNYQLDVGVESGIYMESPDDNYLTGDLGFSSHLEANSRNRFDISLKARKEVEPRGTGLTEGVGNAVDAPLEYNDQRAKLSYEYGSLAATGRVAVSAEYYNKNYTNFLQVTEYRSYNKPTLGSTFYYTTNASTDAFFEIKASTITYDLSESISRDSNVFFALIGFKWDATALTSGSFKIGQEQKNFDDGAREDFKGVSWQGNIDWQPLNYTMVSFITSREAKDPDVQGDYISESVYAFNWQHSWSEAVTTNVKYSYMHEDYSGFERLDKTNDIYLDAVLETSKGTSISLFAQYLDKDSTNQTIIYDKNIIGINFNMFL